MRILTDHKINGLNDGLTVTAEDAPGPGGANHHYTVNFVSTIGRGGGRLQQLAICFQNGPVGSLLDNINGVSNEALLAILIDRMRGFQHLRGPDGGFDFNTRGNYACRENDRALAHLEEALMWLQKRTRDRLARGVEGTSEV